MASEISLTDTRRHIQVRGIVQGVGFRPFVYNLAMSLGLGGYVFNSSAGVTIEVEGREDRIEAFLEKLRSDPPQLAEITEITVTAMDVSGDAAFSILESRQEPGEFVLVSPDAGTCEDCWRDFGDPLNRRLRVPFHELHALRAALHDHPGHSLRPRDDDDVAIQDVRRVRGGIWRSGRPAISCATQCLPRLWAIACAGCARDAARGVFVCGKGIDTPDSCSEEAAVRGEDSCGEGAWRIFTGV